MIKGNARLYALLRNIRNAGLPGIFAVRSIADNRHESEFGAVSDLVKAELRRDRVVIGNSRNVHSESDSNRVEGNLKISNAIVLCFRQGASADIDLYGRQ